MKHLTLFVKLPNGRYDSLAGAFYCEDACEVIHEGETHVCILGGDGK